jgi:hypothetical protein
MYRFLATVGLALFLATGALGGGYVDGPEQMSVPQSKVVVVTPPAPDISDWVTPVAVAAVGTVGLLGAAWISRKRD